MKGDNLNLTIVEAIKSIVTSTDATVKYDVESHIESKGYRNKIFSKVTTVHINIIETQ